MKCPYCIKICSKCGKLLVAYSGNFHKNKKYKYGVRSECKKCRAEHSKQYYEDNKEHYKQYREDNKEKIAEYYKQYREDNKEKIAEYYKQHYEDNKEYYKQYREGNKEKIAERKKQYREDNKEKIAERKKQYREDNKEKIAEYYKQYYEGNKEKIAERKKQYYEENPHISFNARNRRRQREENQGDGITKEQWYEMMMFFDFRCAYSDEYIGGNSEFRTIDHVIPLDKGGEHEIWNLVPMHLSYNSSKQANDMLDWYTKQEFYSEERLNKIYEWIEYAKNKYKN